MEAGNNEAVKKLERDWRSMISISHDFFHRWRMIIEEKLGPEEAIELVNRFWESVGEGTAESYLKRGKDTNNLEQIVDSFVKASLVMGESARSAKDGNEVLLIHEACPWVASFQNYGAPGQCRAGCDKWFEAAVKNISGNFLVQTDSCLAAGDTSCIRRFSEKMTE